MDFAFTDEQAMIAETAQAFFAENATSERTRAAMTTASGMDVDLWDAFTGELGLAGVALSEECGGAGLGHIEMAILAEAAGAHVAALPFLSSLCMVAPAIEAGGSDAQKEWLPKLAAGEAMASFADASDLAVKDGRLSGVADFMPHGAVADVYLLAVGDDVYVLDRTVNGVAVARLVTMDQTRPFARLRLDNARAEPLADSKAGRNAAELSGWTAIAADALGGAQTCLDRTVEYSRERVQFGRAIGSFQAVKHRFADMMVEIEQARSAVYWAACAADEQSEEARLAAHSAKAFACDTYRMCAGNMIQLHGGIGFTWEHDAHLYFKRAQADKTLMGTPDWHREQVAQIIGLGPQAGEAA